MKSIVSFLFISADMLKIFVYFAGLNYKTKEVWTKNQQSQLEVARSRSTENAQEYVFHDGVWIKEDALIKIRILWFCSIVHPPWLINPIF